MANDRNTVSTRDVGAFMTLFGEFDIRLRQDVINVGNIGVVISRIRVGYS